MKKISKHVCMYIMSYPLVFWTHRKIRPGEPGKIDHSGKR